ncbi:ribosome hibernation-promoting factor, HPF/YfiA family [Candidatus Margulisiibacteriota bacterium]
MQITVQGHGMEVTEPLRDYTHKKVGKFEEFFDNIQKVEVTLDARKISSSKRSQVCEITVWTAGRVIRAAEGTSDMYAAIDLVFDKVARQIEKHKEKMKDKKKKQGHKEKEALMELYGQKVEPKHQASPAIVKVKRFPMKPLDPEEATEEMEMLGHDFYMFKNSKTHEVNVVYRRRTGNYGLIEPELI